MIHTHSYGKYHVTKETSKGIQKVHSTDTHTYDWMDDDSDQKANKQARKALRGMFN
jgi:hypothetical protein